MTTIINALSEVTPQYQAIFCDIWGVVHNGERAHMQAVEALMRAREAGLKVMLVTNAPRTPDDIASQLDGFGVPRTAYDAITSCGEAMQHSFFSSGLKRYFFIGRESDRNLAHDLPAGVSNEMSEVADIDDADCILCAGPDYGTKDAPEDYEIELRKAALCDLPLYCANSDIVVDEGERRIWCAGAIAEFYDNLGGHSFHFGKPFPPIYALALSKLAKAEGKNIAPSDVLFVGDGVATDLKGAMQEDLDALFITGGLAAEDTGTNRDADAPRPEAAKLDAFLSAHQVVARFAMGALR